ncbi:hypothetical protein EXT67_21145 [Pectobacterium atrosepticum]|nr:hypothetical protein [Pectobacterium atrosepticum]MCL6318803.1 hypothetical protein [Pectobacterium atrosepticum]
MKQIVEVKVTFEMDYDNVDLAPYLEEKLKTLSMDQIKQQVHETLVHGIKEIVDSGRGRGRMPGLTYTVEDVSL